MMKWEGGRCSLGKHNIVVRETEESFVCGEDEVILSAMIRSRCGPVAHGCFGGGCGVCKMKVESGKFERVKRMSRAHVSRLEEEGDVVLLCCVQPRSDMTICNVVSAK